MGNGCENHVRFLEEHKQAGFTYRAPMNWKNGKKIMAGISIS
jgi:hypothetical protein